MDIINWSNITDFIDIPQQANVVTNGYFWSGMLMMIFIVLFLIMLIWDWAAAFVVSSFICFILALLLLYSGLIGWGTMSLYIALIIISVIFIGNGWASRNTMN